MADQLLKPQIDKRQRRQSSGTTMHGCCDFGEQAPSASRKNNERDVTQSLNAA
jgi:hypothetical protein